MCNCINELNEQIALYNAKISVPTYVVMAAGNKSSRTPAVSVTIEKLDTRIRKPLPKLYASFCPFCGEKYEND